MSHGDDLVSTRTEGWYRLTVALAAPKPSAGSFFAYATVVIMSRVHQGRTRENAVVAVNLFPGIMLIADGERSIPGQSTTERGVSDAYR